MTKRQIEKLQALRMEADMFGDADTIALVDAAMAGDVDAARKIGIAVRAARAVARATCSKAAIRERSMSVQDHHPWAEDVA